MVCYYRGKDATYHQETDQYLQNICKVAKIRLKADGRTCLIPVLPLLLLFFSFYSKKVFPFYIPLY